MDLGRCESCGKKTKEHLHVVDGVIMCFSCNRKTTNDMLFSLIEEEGEIDILSSLSIRNRM